MPQVVSEARSARSGRGSVVRESMASSAGTAQEQRSARELGRESGTGAHGCRRLLVCWAFIDRLVAGSGTGLGGAAEESGDEQADDEHGEDGGGLTDLDADVECDDLPQLSFGGQAEG